MQKALTQMNVRPGSVIGDIMGKTGERILRAIVAGERDPQHQRAFGETANGGDRPVQRARGEHRFLASEITDDALLGAPVLAHALDRIEVA